MRYLTGVFALIASPLWADFTAEDQTPTGQLTTAGEIRQIIEMTRTNWIAVREYNGQDLLYVTHLAAWRCGMHEIRVGVNGQAPEPWPLPECQIETAAPNAIPDDGVTMIYKGYELGAIKRIAVEILFDDMSETSGLFDRTGAEIK